jgi:hypothetical protein
LRGFTDLFKKQLRNVCSGRLSVMRGSLTIVTGSELRLSGPPDA